MSAILDIRRGTRRKRGASTRRSRGGEAIEMRERRHGYFPKLFVWRGQRYRVNAVERCWTISRRNRGGRVERHCFRVRYPEGTFEVYQDIRHNTWHMQRQVA